MRLLSLRLFLRSGLLLLASVSLPGCAHVLTPPAESLPSLVVERLGWMDEVALVKRAKRLPVTDPKREAGLLDAMAREGAALGLPEPAVRAFFSGQIEAAKQHQREWLAQHAHDPEVPGQNLPDLTATVRPALDSIGKKMLTALLSARRVDNPAIVASEVRLRLVKAGYSAAVIQPAVAGVQRSLTLGRRGTE